MQSEQAPQVIAQVRLPRKVPVQQGLDRGWREDARLLHRFFAERLLKQWPQRTAEPFVYRDVETFFGPREDFRRELLTDQFPKNALRSSPLDFEGGGQPGRKFHDAVIQKRRADFERMGHAHPVALI